MLNWVRINSLRDEDELEQLEREHEEDAREEKVRLRMWGSCHHCTYFQSNGGKGERHHARIVLLRFIRLKK